MKAVRLIIASNRANEVSRTAQYFRNGEGRKGEKDCVEVLVEKLPVVHGAMGCSKKNL